MLKIIVLGLLALVSFTVQNGRSTGTQRFAKYKKIEAYEARPGVIMMPRYTNDGKVCEIGLQVQHYAQDRIRLDSNLPSDIDKILDEVVPEAERGEAANNLTDNIIIRSGPGMTTTKQYKNVSVQYFGATTDDSKGKTTVNEIAVTVKWKNRSCQ